MGQRQDAVRKIAADLLSRKKVDAFLGYARGSLPMRERPVLVREPHQISTLVWSGFCVGNLAKYLRKTSGRVGIVAQGCVSRNIVGLIRERQVERDQVFVLGMPCLGMLDRQKIQAAVQGRGIMAVDDDGGPEIVVRGADFEQSLVRAHMRRDNCMTCMHRNPVLHDELAADPGEETGGGDLDAVAAPWEKLESAKRYEAFSRLVGQCVRCYACRDVCPLCYCPQCFVDESRPQWCGKGQSDPDVQTFHLLRALH